MTAVFEIGRQQVALSITEIIGDQVRGLLCLDGLIRKEIDGEIRQADEAREQVHH